MTSYAARNAGNPSQDYNLFFSNQHLGISQYSNGDGLNYLYGNGQVQYQPVGSPCSSYSPAYLPGQSTPSSPLYMPNTPVLALQYQNLRAPTLPSQSRPLSRPYYATTSSGERNVGAQHPCSTHEAATMEMTEEQHSTNADTKLSEPILPPLPGFPDVHEFDELMKRYVDDLSPKKQDKALIHASRAANIKSVLIDKKTTTIESAQFRFWVKKMFTLQPNDPSLPEKRKKICHEGKPVAVREKLFKILTKAHKQCQHGGRDKTSAHVRRTYSWQVDGSSKFPFPRLTGLFRVPKELISRFVKLCPTCQVRRGPNRNSPPDSERSPEVMTEAQSPDVPSGSSSRRNTSTHRQIPSSENLSSQAGFATSSTFEQQNRWMTPLPPQDVSMSRTSHLTLNNNLNCHEGYSIIPPMPMNCTNATPPGLSFSSVSPFVNGSTATAAFTTGASYKPSRGHLPPAHNYGAKLEQTFM
ncbi:uncharacterized protein A1O9_01852 [Exophiala aquamarina CBS 119918]|uniref:Integrase zinc-binding domain-containing protein n=1 Tax=Exophiala aquamarina CBS 119918 TaxID=1182545 RepID=A0A072PUX9_9EURO|nr:uncharacterized protein A1O9_01852 [Exophiala aquamarina CBS 119918]KEF63874.1 hypothetical protein A1O9_01852 [Exophiala aquamarina CBS 119918]